jgi:phosphoribosyl isomerase A
VSLTLLPAVDVAGGLAVRLVQGEAGSESAHGDPLEVALGWQDAGAEWVHLVDLDAAFGRGSNAELLASVIAKLDVKVELSAGVRDDASLEWALSTGCERVILSTTALGNLDWCAQAIRAHRDRIAVGLDVRIVLDSSGAEQHRLVARGWAHDVGELRETIERFNQEGCTRYVVTDVSRDGMLSGPNVALYRAVTRSTSAQVIASGGIGSIGDLVVLAQIASESTNLEGSIVGKALYSGRFTLPEALDAVRQVATEHGRSEG